MEVDHVLVAVASLDGPVRELERRLGVTAVDGGVHPAWGTANRIVPLGGTFLEIVAVVDPERAAGSAFGQWVAAGVADPPRPLGWAVRVSNIESEAARLRLEVSAGSRARPDGSVVRWRICGLEVAAAEPALPFLIQWDPGVAPPGRTVVSHAAGSVRLAELTLRGDPNRVAAWFGDHRLPVTVQRGPSALVAVHLEIEGRRVEV